MGTVRASPPLAYASGVFDLALLTTIFEGVILHS
jgi:hypothetical protein